MVHMDTVTSRTPTLRIVVVENLPWGKLCDSEGWKTLSLVQVPVLAMGVETSNHGCLLQVTLALRECHRKQPILHPHSTTYSKRSSSIPGHQINELRVQAAVTVGALPQSEHSPPETSFTVSVCPSFHLLPIPVMANPRSHTGSCRLSFLFNVFQGVKSFKVVGGSLGSRTDFFFLSITGRVQGEF